MRLQDIVDLFSLPGDLEFASSVVAPADNRLRYAFLEYRCVAVPASLHTYASCGIGTRHDAACSARCCCAVRWPMRAQRSHCLACKSQEEMRRRRFTCGFLHSGDVLRTSLTRPRRVRWGHADTKFAGFQPTSENGRTCSDGARRRRSSRGTVRLRRCGCRAATWSLLEACCGPQRLHLRRLHPLPRARRPRRTMRTRRTCDCKATAAGVGAPADVSSARDDSRHFQSHAARIWWFSAPRRIASQRLAATARPDAPSPRPRRRTRKAHRRVVMATAAAEALAQHLAPGTPWWRNVSAEEAAKSELAEGWSAGALDTARGFARDAASPR